mgnify:FL=1
MKKLASLVLASAMAVVPFAAGLAATFTPGEYEATAQGFAGAVTVKVTVDEEKVTAVTVTGENETPALGGAAIEGYNASLIGVADADASHAADKLEKLGRPLSRREEAACYQPMKALCACLIVFGVPLVLGAYLAATAEPYTYALQDLPSWLTGTYGAREDVMAPLAAYAQTASVSARDIIRLIVRLTVLIYINLFPDPQTMTQLVDQLTPLMVLSYPVACMIGYLRAPAVYAKRQSMQRRAKKAAVRKAQKKSMVSELLGSGGDVHYGQRPQQEEHKKKELI